MRQFKLTKTHVVVVCCGGEEKANETARMLRRIRRLTVLNHRRKAREKWLAGSFIHQLIYTIGPKFLRP